MNLLVELLIWGVTISLILIPTVRWFWKFWDRPSAEVIERIQQRQDEQLEKEAWIAAEQAEREAEFEKLKWIRKPPAKQLTIGEKSDALDALDQTVIESGNLGVLIPQIYSDQPIKLEPEVKGNQGPVEPPDPTKEAEAKIMAQHRSDIDGLLSDASSPTGFVTIEDDFWCDIYW